MLKRNQYHGRRCSFEGLEQRRMMAGDVVVKMSGENLIINGNRLDNAITITAGAIPGQVIVQGQTAGGSATRINGTPNGTTTLNGFFGDLKVNMASGQDSLTINGVTVRGNTTLKTGRGIDNVAILNVNSWGNVKVKTGNGSDNLTVANTTVAGKTVLKTGTGNDLVTVTNLATNKLKVSTGKGNDQVSLINVTAAKATLNGGSGVNKLGVAASFLPKTSVKKFV
ncbi:MAG: hypothetical protein U0805_08815 [Pirellulales bacterium]